MSSEDYLEKRQEQEVQLIMQPIDPLASSPLSSSSTSPIDSASSSDQKQVKNHFNRVFQTKEGLAWILRRLLENKPRVLNLGQTNHQNNNFFGDMSDEENLQERIGPNLPALLEGFSTAREAYEVHQKKTTELKEVKLDSMTDLDIRLSEYPNYYFGAIISNEDLFRLFPSLTELSGLARERADVVHYLPQIMSHFLTNDAAFAHLIPDIRALQSLQISFPDYFEQAMQRVQTNKKEFARLIEEPGYTLKSFKAADMKNYGASYEASFARLFTGLPTSAVKEDSKENYRQQEQDSENTPVSSETSDTVLSR